LVALGSALLIVPGLVVAALLLFVPVVVVFERVAGTAALLRSMALVRMDVVRVIVVMLAAVVLGRGGFWPGRPRDARKQPPHYGVPAPLRWRSVADCSLASAGTGCGSPVS
jgi:hypothetical protein